MGNSALLGVSPKDAKRYEVGADLPQGGKLLEIGTDNVVLEVQGKKQTITVFPELKMKGPGEEGGPGGMRGRVGGEVLSRAGGTPVSLPGGELFTSLQSGAIDATEWVGPYNDLAFGFYKAARYYYYPGWHEPGTTLECMVNKAAFDALPDDLQAIVLAAARVANQDMLTEYIARNNRALRTLVDEHQVDVRKLPDSVLERLRELSDQVVAEVAAKDDLSHRVHASFQAFRDQVVQWSDISARAYLNARGETAT